MRRAAALSAVEAAGLLRLARAWVAAERRVLVAAENGTWNADASVAAGDARDAFERALAVLQREVKP